MFTVALSMLLLASSTDTAAPTPSQPTEVQQTDETSKAERKICKRERATESRLRSTRVCLTAEEWRERQRATSEGLRGATK